jgi:hypothetical protein
MDPTGSPAFQRFLPFIRERLVPAYISLKQPAFVYCQGSMIEGLSDSSDIDLVFVWDGKPPDRDVRPPAGITDDAPRPRVWQRQESFHASGQEFGVAHHMLREWETWIDELTQGRGCEGYPTPVIAAHGLQSGLLVHDPEGTWLALRQRLESFPERLRLDAPRRASDAMPDYLNVLEDCARMDDDLLFHGELVKAARLLWIGWFSANRRYWPLEKRLGRRLGQMGRPDLAAAEKQVWMSGPGLSARLMAFRELSETLLAEMHEAES